MMRLKGWKVVAVHNNNHFELEDGPNIVHDCEIEIHCFKIGQDQYYKLKHVFKGYIEQHVESTVAEHVSSISLADKVIKRIEEHGAIDLQFWDKIN